MKTTDLKQTAKLDAAVMGLQNQLLDHTGHVRRGLPRQEAQRLITTIGLFRQELGWEPLDMKGRWRRSWT
jgi:hypothetical protein